MLLFLLINILLYSQELVEEAIITDIKGVVEVLRVNTTYWQRIEKDDFLYIGDIVRTGKDGSAEIVFSDGNIVELTPFSKLKIEKIDVEKGEKLELEIGGVLIKVEKGKGFEIKTRHAVCAVRGTEFAVSVSKENTHVGVFSGKILLRHYDAKGRLAKRALVLRKNYETLVRMYLPPSRPKRLGRRMRFLKERMKRLRKRAKILRERMKRRFKERVKLKRKRAIKRQKIKRKRVKEYMRKRRRR
ncbi:MAG: hypothetical protein DRI36_03350 [Caldiserica bacterium]|nr:MAG: hypothetical protein DRI36_03350 [Caldisericota bacterium]